MKKLMLAAVLMVALLMSNASSAQAFDVFLASPGSVRVTTAGPAPTRPLYKFSLDTDPSTPIPSKMSKVYQPGKIIRIKVYNQFGVLLVWGDFLSTRSVFIRREGSAWTVGY